VPEWSIRHVFGLPRRWPRRARTEAGADVLDVSACSRSRGAENSFTLVRFIGRSADEVRHSSGDRRQTGSEIKSASQDRPRLRRHMKRPQVPELRMVSRGRPSPIPRGAWIQKWKASSEAVRAQPLRVRPRVLGSRGSFRGGLSTCHGARRDAAPVPQLSAAASPSSKPARAAKARRTTGRTLPSTTEASTPEGLAERALAGWHAPVPTPPVETDGAARARAPHCARARHRDGRSARRRFDEKKEVNDEKLMTVLYGFVAYVTFQVTILYASASGWLRCEVDRPRHRPSRGAGHRCVCCRSLRRQHSVMAGAAWFKRIWTRFVPKSVGAAVTYVLAREPRPLAPLLAMAADSKARSGR